MSHQLKICHLIWILINPDYNLHCGELGSNAYCGIRMRIASEKNAQALAAGKVTNISWCFPERVTIEQGSPFSINLRIKP